MKKSTKWILIASGVLLVLLTVAIIIAIAVKDSYLEKLPYDEIHSTAYNQTKIVSEDGLFYLVTDGAQSKEGYSYLKSVNDFYEENGTNDSSFRPLYEYYLAKKPNDTNYWLVHSNGSEYRIEGDNLSLTEASLPFLIFRSNANSRMSALSLRSLDSNLSATGEGTLTLTQTHLYLHAQKADGERVGYDYLVAQNDQEGKQCTVYSAQGTALLDGGTPSLLSFERESGDLCYYFIDTNDHKTYSSTGELLASGDTDPVLSSDESWAYQLCKGNDTISEDSLFLFSAEQAFSVSGREYDLSTLRILEGCIVVERLHEHAIDVISPTTREITSYQSVAERDGILLASQADVPDWIYLSLEGKELLRSSYDDMKLHELTTDLCYVLTSPSYNNSLPEKSYAYFFSSGNGASAEKRLALDETVRIPEGLCLEDTSSPVYLIAGSDQDGTPLYRIYTPFSSQPESNIYHEIDFYCHGGIVWALGTSYTRESYDVLDPVNNLLTISIAAKNTDLARLSLSYCETQSLLSDPYNSQSGIHTVILKLTRYEDKQAGVVATRYFAIYRSALAASPAFATASLQVKELGQNLLLNHPYDFYPEENALVIHHATGSRVYRFNDANRLEERASVPYYVDGILRDGANASKLYLKISSVTDQTRLLTQSERFGIADETGTILLAPVYETISYAEQNRFIAISRNAYGVVEYDEGKLRTLVDFEYRRVIPLADGAYLATASDGTYELFLGDQRLERGILNYTPIQMARVNEDGYVVYATAPLLNIEGRLYFHEPEQYAPLAADGAASPVSHSGELTDRRVKLISYYDESGALSASDLLLPTVTDQKNFETNHTGEWYTSPVAKEQEAPLTRKDILASSDHFFHLYPKVGAEGSK